jgi:hypothetical protein
MWIVKFSLWIEPKSFFVILQRTHLMWMLHSIYFEFSFEAVKNWINCVKFHISCASWAHEIFETSKENKKNVKIWVGMLCRFLKSPLWDFHSKFQLFSFLQAEIWQIFDIFSRFLLDTYGIWRKYWFREEKNKKKLLLIFTF